MLAVTLLLTSIQISNPVSGPLPPNVHLEAGAPGYGVTGNYLLIREGYAALVSQAYHDPLWSQEQLEGNHLLPPQMARKDAFAPDPDLPAGAGSTLGDYRGSGYDRGHMAPSADFRWASAIHPSDPASVQRESFYLSNMVPQNGPLNQRMWAGLEDQTRKWAKQYGLVQIITGPVFKTAHPKTIGNGVAVPDAVFKIVVVWEGADRLRSMAVEVPNVKPTKSLDKYTTTIGKIEADIHLDFFTTLLPSEKEKLDNGTGPQLPVPALTGGSGVNESDTPEQVVKPVKHVKVKRTMKGRSGH